MYFVNVLEKCIAVQKYRCMLVLFAMKTGGEKTLESQN